MKFGALVNVWGGMAGPAGSNTFILLNSYSASLATPILKAGKYVTGAGKALGVGFMAVGIGVGMYDDIKNNNKTAGEAVAHNTASTGAGVLGSIGGTAATTGVLTLLGISNPAGWAILGGIAIGAVATGVFNYLYDSNKWGIQDGLDAVGKEIDNLGKQVSETFESVKEGIGEAVSSFGKAINPMNWAW